MKMRVWWLAPKYVFGVNALKTSNNALLRNRISEPSLFIFILRWRNWSLFPVSSKFEDSERGSKMLLQMFLFIITCMSAGGRSKTVSNQYIEEKTFLTDGLYGMHSE